MTVDDTENFVADWRQQIRLEDAIIARVLDFVYTQLLDNNPSRPPTLAEARRLIQKLHERLPLHDYPRNDDVDEDIPF